MDDVDLRTSIRPFDAVEGERVAWQSPVGVMRGYRAAGNPRQGRTVPGCDNDPHGWYLPVADEEDWFRFKYTGGATHAQWVQLSLVAID